MIVRIYILPDYLRGSISPSIVRTSGQNLPDDLQGPFKYRVHPWFTPKTLMVSIMSAMDLKVSITTLYKAILQ